MSEHKVFTVPDGLDEMRIDTGVARLLGLSRSAVAHLIEAGAVLQNSRPVSKSDRLTAGSMLEVNLPDQEPALTITAEPVPGMQVLYSDDDIVVVDKPVGVAAHASIGWTGLTVTGGLAAAGYRISTHGPAERQGIVHRLDAGTSGIMVVATSERAYSALKRAFKYRQVEKQYHALVQGHPDPSSGTIDAPIARSRGNDWKFTVNREGKPSITHYDTLQAFRAASLLNVHLETGRTHQIRVHFSALHHPCCGDPIYGADSKLSAQLGLNRQWLHAVSLCFEHPGTGEKVSFTSDYPEDLRYALQVLNS